ncbi:MAG: Transcriptional regulator, AraC family protein [Myxococcales bacterium]|nr:Transcriptional regulator, AraC family protein [Myxococcales bacterium]
MTTPTALAALARTALDAAQRVGIAPDEVLSRAKLSRDLVDELDGRIPVASLLHLWQVAAEMSDDPFFGLHAGEHVVSARTIHIVGFAARSSASLGECYEHTVRFAALTNEASEIEVVRERGRGCVIVNPRPGLPIWPRVYAEMAMAGYFCLGQRWVGVPIKPVEVAFQHPRPADISAYERLFECPLHFGASKNRLVFTERVFALPLGTTDRDLLAYFQEKASTLLETVEGATLGQRVREVIGQVLGSQAPTLTFVARRLAMSPRTLQRRLAAESLQFGDIVDDVRCVTGLHLLASNDCDIATVAFRTGYRDLDAFRAAVLRWTGKTPRDVRRSS